MERGVVLENRETSELGLHDAIRKMLQTCKDYRLIVVKLLFV